jgi:fructokinase
VGQDDLGREVITRLNGLERGEIQSDPVHPTGTVQVSVDSAGQAKFEIKADVAWDFLEWTPQWLALAKQCEAVCFGSLAQRSSQSRKTIQVFLEMAHKSAVCVFDVNLRQHFYSAEVLSASAQFAHILKLNHDELPIVTKMLGYEDADERSGARWLLKKFGFRLVCVTRGVRGSLMMNENDEAEHRGFQVKVADTVGAGDAFTAALVHHYLQDASLGVMSQAANQLGAWVASQAGAMPVPDQAQLEKLRAGRR